MACGEVAAGKIQCSLHTQQAAILCSIWRLAQNCYFVSPHDLDLTPHNKCVPRTHHGKFLCQVWWSQLHRFLKHHVEKTDKHINAATPATAIGVGKTSPTQFLIITLHNARHVVNINISGGYSISAWVKRHHKITSEKQWQITCMWRHVDQVTTYTRKVWHSQYSGTALKISFFLHVRIAYVLCIPECYFTVCVAALVPLHATSGYTKSIFLTHEAHAQKALSKNLMLML